MKFQEIISYLCDWYNKQCYKGNKKMNTATWSFERGFQQLRLCDVDEVRAEIMDVLGVTTNMSFLRRKAGKIEPKISEARAVEEIFAKRGITDVWG